MVSAGVSMRGKTRIHFTDTSKTKVNSECYIKLLNDNLLPDSRTLYPDNNCTHGVKSFFDWSESGHVMKNPACYLSMNAIALLSVFPNCCWYLILDFMQAVYGLYLEFHC